ncbi:MAG TPA: NAD(P)-binding protein [Candidatus Poseidoniaceae archaeon]|nr:MAG TPA: FAD-binding protein [Candidatus Poseidoniales archaeon]HII96992.1 NAD(P)-binding protein [Candidatus Poseidoniaceae archaeon]
MTVNVGIVGGGLAGLATAAALHAAGHDVTVYEA